MASTNFTYYKNDGTSTSATVGMGTSTSTTAPYITDVGDSHVNWTRSGYNFVEWNSSSSGAGTSYSPGDTISLKNYDTLYAIWEEQHEITVVYKDATISSLDSGGNITLNTAGKYCEGNITIDYIRPSAPVPVLQSKTVSSSTSQQTISPDSGYDGLSDVTVNAMPNGSAGTPTATKGAVSNHAVSVTPSVTNTTGYITGGTINGTAVSVSASELVSGTLSVNSSGTKDVTNYASVSIPSGSASISSFTSYGSITVDIDELNGEIIAYSSRSINITPSISAGYISSGTSGSINISDYGSMPIDFYNGEHHQPPIITFSLTNPVNSSYFDSCEIYEEQNGETKLGEITSTTGSISIDLTDRFDWWDVSTLNIAVMFNCKSGGRVFFESSGISCAGNASFDSIGIGSDVAFFTITSTGTGTIVIDSVDYNWGA